MEGSGLLLYRSLGIVCKQRTHSSLSPSSSSSFASSKFLHVDSPEKLVGLLGQVSVIHSWDGISLRKLNALKYDSESAILESSGGPKSSRSESLSDSGKIREGEDCPIPAINASSIQTGSIWDQCRRVVKTDETSDEEAIWLAANIMLRTGHARFAAISARTHRPPLPVPQRSKVPRYVKAGVALSLAAFIVWQVSKSESYARDQLISRDEAAVTPHPQQTVTAYSKAKASVAQTAFVNRAVAAVRNNNFMECTIEMELALEENRLARTSIESDFYEEEEIWQVYQGVIKMWYDGYPLDYGRVLQLRNLLDVPSPKADILEQEVLQQSDSYVI